jgi:hypothetical protein
MRSLALPSINKFRDTSAAVVETFGNIGNHENGVFNFPFQTHPQWMLKVIVAIGMGWEHVSASYPDRTPHWEEMCALKALLWDPEDAVMQIHPPKSEYVNCHPYTLHLWKPIGMDFLRPPSLLVGGGRPNGGG